MEEDDFLSYPYYELYDDWDARLMPYWLLDEEDIDDYSESEYLKEGFPDVH